MEVKPPFLINWIKTVLKHNKSGKESEKGRQKGEG
jgi:hypothetical protein